jgi:Calx-beta domain
VTVRLEAAQSTSVSVGYQTITGPGVGTATADTDFTAQNSTLTFAAGQVTQTISISIMDDSMVEERYKTLRLELFSPTGTTLASPSSATLTIIDDDGAPPTATPLYLVTGGPAAPANLGYYYTEETSGYGYLIFTVPCTWPTDRPLTFELWSPAMHPSPSQDLARANGTRSSTEFELYDLGPANAGASLTPPRDTGLYSKLFLPNDADEGWQTFYTISSPAACGRYALRSAAASDDENYWAARAGFATDGDPTTPLDPSVPNSAEQVTTTTLQMTTEHLITNTVTTLWFFVAPETGTLRLRNFDLDYGASGWPLDAGACIRFYEPGALYDPLGVTGGSAGTTSAVGWEEDTLSNPKPGWWRAVVYTTIVENAYIVEAVGDGMALPIQYEAPLEPKMTLGLTASQPTAAPGDRLSLTLAYTSTGVASAASPTLTLRLPDELAFDGDPCGGTPGCSLGADGTLTLIKGQLTPGAWGSLVVGVAVKPGATGPAAVGLAAGFSDASGNPAYVSTATVVGIE